MNVDEENRPQIKNRKQSNLTFQIFKPYLIAILEENPNAKVSDIINKMKELFPKITYNRNIYSWLKKAKNIMEEKSNQ